MIRDIVYYSCVPKPQNFGGWPSPLSDDATMSRAKDALLKGFPNAKVAELCGYHSESAFSHAFRAITGYPPKQWVTHQAGGEV